VDGAPVVTDSAGMAEREFSRAIGLAWERGRKVYAKVLSQTGDYGRARAAEQEAYDRAMDGAR